MLIWMLGLVRRRVVDAGNVRDGVKYTICILILIPPRCLEYSSDIPLILDNINAPIYLTPNPYPAPHTLQIS